jgi:predicted metalloprotease with PDZ domain
MRRMRLRALLWLTLLPAAACGRPAPASVPAPIVYTMRFLSPDAHLANIEARIPADGQTRVELMLPVWSPGYYRVEDYAANVKDFRAENPAGAALTVSKPKENHWAIATGGAAFIDVSYAVVCERQFVTGCWVGHDDAVINGPSTFMTTTDHKVRPYELQLELPANYRESITSMTPMAGGPPDHYSAENYDVFIDSPIVLGSISTHEFTVGETRHILADFGDPGAWDGAAAAATLQRVVEEHRRMLGELPFRRYVSLTAYRRAAGGRLRQN